MADRRMNERREDERDEKIDSDDKERRGQNLDRRVMARLSNKSIYDSAEQLLFWLKVLFSIVSLVGLFILGKSITESVKDAVPGLILSAFVFSFSYYIYNVHHWLKDFLSNESKTSFEILFEKLMGLVRFMGIVSSLTFVLYLVVSL